MSTRLDDPDYWAGLYRRPKDADSVEFTGGGFVLEQADFVAEITLEDSAEPPPPSGDLTELVQRLVTEQVEAMLASGAGVAASGARPAPTEPAAPSASAAAPAASSVPVAPAASSAPSAAQARPEPTPPAATPPTPPAAAPHAPAPPNPPTAAPRAPAPPNPPTAAPRAPAPPNPKPAAAREPSPPAVDIEALLSRRPSLPGGATSLMAAEGLSQDATMLLVMVDGNTSLKGLRTLAPHLDQERFIAIIRDAMRRGLVMLD